MQDQLLAFAPAADLGAREAELDMGEIAGFGDPHAQGAGARYGARAVVSANPAGAAAPAMQIAATPDLRLRFKLTVY